MSDESVDYVGVSKTKKRKRAVSKCLDNRSEEGKAYSCRFNEGLPQKPIVVFL
jgi:hypothetical protein